MRAFIKYIFKYILATKNCSHKQCSGQQMKHPAYGWNNFCSLTALLIVLLGVISLSGCTGLAGASATSTDGKTSNTDTPSTAPSITTQPVSQNVCAAGQTAATFSVATTGTTPLTYQWLKNAAAISGATSSSYMTPPTTPSDNNALFTVAVTNSAGSATSSPATLDVAAAAAPAAPAAVAISVSPTSTTVTAGATQQFTATVTGISNTSVTWGVSGAGCKGAVCGTISSGGLYTSPSRAPSHATVSVTATSVADPKKSASASVTIVAAVAVLVSISPTSASVPAVGMQSFTATVTGASNTAVAWSLSGPGCSGSACGTLSTNGLSAVYAAPSVAPSPSGVNVIVTSAADPSKSASATVTVVPAIVITVSPTSASVATGATQQLSASVTGTSNTGATWTVKGSGCSGTACGVINSNGLYTAPPAIPSPATVAVTAASVADPSKTNSAFLTIVSATSNAIDGLNIPATHPRLFLNSARIAAANTWVRNTNYAGVMVDYRPLDYYDLAFACFIMNNGTACSTVIADAVAFAPSSSNGTGAGDDNMRRNGEWVMLVRDWLAPGCGAVQCLTSAQASAIDSNWSTWQIESRQPGAVLGERYRYAREQLFRGAVSKMTSISESQATTTILTPQQI